jgi:hypothetical protein
LTEKIEQISDNIKKYGLLAAIVTATYFGAKKVWSWVGLPVMLYYSLLQLDILFNWQVVQKLDIKYVIIMWLFVFSLLKKIFSGLFEINEK